MSVFGIGQEEVSEASCRMSSTETMAKEGLGQHAVSHEGRHRGLSALFSPSTLESLERQALTLYTLDTRNIGLNKLL